MGVFLSLSSLSLVLHIFIILLSLVFEAGKKVVLGKRAQVAKSVWQLPMIQIEQL